MKTTLIALIMVMGLLAKAFGAGADAELKKIEEQWLDAYMKGDAAPIKSIEADDYYFVEPDGTVSNKADDVKAVADKKFVMKSATMTDFKCRMIGENSAVVTATVTMSGTDEGEAFSGDFRGIDVFEKKDGKWMCVASQLTKIAKQK